MGQASRGWVVASRFRFYSECDGWPLLGGGGRKRKQLDACSLVCILKEESGWYFGSREMTVDVTGSSQILGTLEDRAYWIS